MSLGELAVLSILGLVLLMYWGKIFYDYGFGEGSQKGFEEGKHDGWYGHKEFLQRRRQYESGNDTYDSSYPDRSKRNGREGVNEL